MTSPVREMGLPADPSDPRNSHLAYIVVWTQCIVFSVCVLALAATMFFKNYSDPVVLTALIGLTSVLGGNLASILGGPRTMMMGPTKTEITNPPDKPVPVAETPKPQDF